MEEGRIFGPEKGLSKPESAIEGIGPVSADTESSEGGMRSGESERRREWTAADASIREAIGNIAGCISSGKEDGPTGGSGDDLERLMRFCVSGGAERGKRRTNMLKALMITILMSGPGSVLLNRTAEAETVRSSKKIERIHHPLSKNAGNLAMKGDDGSWERMERSGDREWDADEKRSDREWDAFEKKTDRDWEAMEERMEKTEKSSRVINEADW